MDKLCADKILLFIFLPLLVSRRVGLRPTEACDLVVCWGLAHHNGRNDFSQMVGRRPTLQQRLTALRWARVLPTAILYFFRLPEMYIVIGETTK